jgi:glutamyl-tRNA reductase
MPQQADESLDAVRRAVIRQLAEVGGNSVVPHLAHASGRQAVTHLYRVAASLDSLVVGEPQILGQLKDAIALAREHNTIGAKLDRVVRSALKVAKQVRSETAIGAGQVSVPSVAVDLARQIFDRLDGRTSLLVGAGEMAESAAKLLARAGADLLVCNRSPERGNALAQSVGGRARAWDHLPESLVDADIVITSTASTKHVITAKQLKKIRRARRGRSLFLIDIAVPRDVEPRVNNLDNVYLYDIDDLSHVVAEARAGRADEARRAEEIVQREMLSFERQMSEQAVTPVVVGLRERTRGVLHRELKRSLKGRLKHLGGDEREALRIMLDAAVNKLMHAPTRHLKEMASSGGGADYADLLSELFELDEFTDDSPQSGPMERGSRQAAGDADRSHEHKRVRAGRGAGEHDGRRRVSEGSDTEDVDTEDVDTDERDAALPDDDEGRSRGAAAG